MTKTNVKLSEYTNEQRGKVPSFERKALYRLERGGHTKGKLLVAPVSYALGQSYRRMSQTPPMN